MKRQSSPIPAILSEQQYRSCRLCPRECGADRTVSANSADHTVSADAADHTVNAHAADHTVPAHTAGSVTARRPGYCGCPDHIMAARAALHPWEEPCISGNSRGSGTVFFSGCTLGCCFCQNYPISHGNYGKEITIEDLADIFLRLQDQGAHNINLVTATQYLPSIVRALDMVRDRLRIPVVYNCGGYERPEIIQALADYVDIWLPDLKYFDPGLAARYSQAGNYFDCASRAIPQMIAQTGPPVLDSGGIMRSGVIIRHLVLPGTRLDSIRLLHWMKENLPEGGYLLSLLSQYTPAGEAARPSATGQSAAAVSASSTHTGGHAATGSSASTTSGTTSTGSVPELTRRVTTFEYESVLNTAIDLGLTAGYMQQKSSAKEEYTPPFDLEGI